MSRQLKFRIWDKEFKEFVSPSYYYISLNGEVIGEGSDYTYLADETQYVIEQYTCVHDLKGVEIYEGDIVRVSFDANIITLSDGKELMGLGMVPSEVKRRHKDITVTWNKLGLAFDNFTSVPQIGALGNETLEVIGNIHEKTN